MKLKFLLVLHLFFNLGLKAQNEVLNFNWLNALIANDNHGEPKVSLLTTDSVKNVYCFGKRKGDFTFSTPNNDNLIWSSNPIQYFLSKQDKDGNLVWYKDLPIPILQATVDVISMATDNSGGLYLVGNYRGKVDFNFDANVSDTIQSLYNDYDMFLCKYDSNANFIYCKTFGGPYSDIIESACFDKDMNVYLLGSFDEDCDFDPSPLTYTLTTSNYSLDFTTPFFGKYDNSGNLVFAQRIATDHKSFFKPGNLSYNSSRDIVHLTVMFRDSVKLSSSNAPIYLYSEFPESGILTYSSFGNLLFAKGVASWSSSDARYNDVCVSDSNKNMYLLYNLGSLDTITLCNGKLILDKEIGKYSSLLVKTDSMGDCVWSHLIGSEFNSHVYTFGIHVNSKGECLLYGIYCDSVNFSASNVVNYLYSPLYARNLFLAKYNSNDSLIFVNKLIDGEVDVFTVLPNKLFVKENDIYVTGVYSPLSWISEKSDFDISAKILKPNFTDHANNGYVIKYNTCEAGSLSATSNPSLLCVGNNSSLSYSSTPSTNTYTWSNSCTFPICVVTPTVNTVYKISTTFSNGCVATNPVEVYIKDCVGVKEYEFQETHFDVYPNPVNNVLEIYSTKEADLIIVNSIGKVFKKFSVKEEAKQNVNIDDLESGVYYVISNETSIRCSRKIVVIK